MKQKTWILKIQKNKNFGDATLIAEDKFTGEEIILSDDFFTNNIFINHNMLSEVNFKEIEDALKEKGYDRSGCLNPYYYTIDGNNGYFILKEIEKPDPKTYNPWIFKICRYNYSSEAYLFAQDILTGEIIIRENSYEQIPLLSNDNLTFVNLRSSHLLNKIDEHGYLLEKNVNKIIENDCYTHYILKEEYGDNPKPNNNWIFRIDNIYESLIAEDIETGKIICRIENFADFLPDNSLSYENFETFLMLDLFNKGYFLNNNVNRIDCTLDGRSYFILEEIEKLKSK